MLFPGEDIQAHSNGKSVVLSGNVSRKEVVDKAIAVAAGYVEKKDDVVTLLAAQPGPAAHLVIADAAAFGFVGENPLDLGADCGIGFIENSGHALPHEAKARQKDV